MLAVFREGKYSLRNLTQKEDYAKKITEMVLRECLNYTSDVRAIGNQMYLEMVIALKRGDLYLAAQFKRLANPVGYINRVVYISEGDSESVDISIYNKAIVKEIRKKDEYIQKYILDNVFKISV